MEEVRLGKLNFLTLCNSLRYVQRICVVGKLGNGATTPVKLLFELTVLWKHVDNRASGAGIVGRRPARACAIPL